METQTIRCEFSELTEKLDALTGDALLIVSGKVDEEFDGIDCMEHAVLQGLVWAANRWRRLKCSYLAKLRRVRLPIMLTTKSSAERL